MTNAAYLENQKTISENIKNAREAAGLTQAHLAEMVGECRETIKNWESGTRQIKAVQIARLSVALGVTSDYLLGLSTFKLSNVNQNEALKMALNDIIQSGAKIVAATSFIQSIT